ncbi:MAG TPA: E3 binding domain-containing protein [Paraburkholderia sp.]|uniref:E3 binding domain-containing protein n=1 Tax=Paraburkholderia sp. TaxID=1926495 RepID=UPI002B47EF94|nr:E3 binding domain-containing protein [Paraburkholderia sp.]HKR45850.1 E3 binding domain-containing protein [Paraburkholderia sp.]
MKVEFTYGKGGKKVLMRQSYAETLRKLGHGTYETRMLTAAPPPPPAPVEPLVSEAIAEFAAENGVDLKTVVGTGKDGRIRKSDVEAVIAARTQE